MPRSKTVSDASLLDVTLGIIRERGPEAVTFASVARRARLSASTLVQRFSTKAGMVQAALLHAWDVLDDRTRREIAASDRTSAGAVSLLVRLSTDYGADAKAYAKGLVLLREDLKDPLLRARGAAWRRELLAAVDACLAHEFPGRNLGSPMLSAWQGCLTWWAFEPAGLPHQHVERELHALLESWRVTEAPDP